MCVWVTAPFEMRVRTTSRARVCARSWGGARPLLAVRGYSCVVLPHKLSRVRIFHPRNREPTPPSRDSRDGTRRGQDRVQDRVLGVMDKIEYKRLEYKHEGRTIYEWYQSLEEVHVFISPPPGVTSKMIDCKIMSTQLTIGIKGNPPFIDEPFAEFVNAAESYWTWEDAEAPREGKELHLCITKGSKGVTWSSLLRGHTEVDPLTQQELQKSLMLERFQAENPGFDFSGASFNGQVPNAKTFMGGVGYQ